MNIQKNFLLFLISLFFLWIISSLLFWNLDNLFFILGVISIFLIFHKLFFEIIKFLKNNIIVWIFTIFLILIAIYIPISDWDSLYYHYPIAISFLDNWIFKVPDLPKVWNADIFAYYPSFWEFLQAISLALFRSDIFLDWVQIIFYVLIIVNILQNFKNSKKYILMVLSIPVLILNTLSWANDVIILYLFLNIFISFWNIFHNKFFEKKILNDEIIIIVLSTFLLFSTKYTSIIYLFFIFNFFLFYFLFLISEKKYFLKNIYKNIDFKKIIPLFFIWFIIWSFFYIRNTLVVWNPIFPLNMIWKINYATFWQFIQQFIIDKDYYLHTFRNYNYGFGIFFTPLIIYLFFVNFKINNKIWLFFLFIFSFFIFVWFFKIQTVPYHKYYIFIYILLFIFFIISIQTEKINKKLELSIIILSWINILSLFPYIWDLQNIDKKQETNFIKQVKNFSLKNINNYKYIWKTFLFDSSQDLNDYIQNNIKNKNVALSNPVFFQVWYNAKFISNKNKVYFLDNYLVNQNKNIFSCDDLNQKYKKSDYFFAYNINQKHRTFWFKNGKIFLKKINDGENRVQYKIKIPNNQQKNIKVEYEKIENSINYIFYNNKFYKLDKNKNKIEIPKNKKEDFITFILFTYNTKTIVFDSSIEIKSINNKNNFNYFYEKLPIEDYCFSWEKTNFNDWKLTKIKNNFYE